MFSNVFNHHYLQEENAEGDQSEFMEAVRDQYLNEIQTFCRDIYKQLSKADHKKTNSIPAGQVEAILKELDPDKPLEVCRSATMWATLFSCFLV
jgi:hypothetical protein